MDRIIIEGVRCFHDRQTVPLRPITLLVGENSTGKSTFLALVRLAWDICGANSALDFNEEPFRLGEYNDIATYRGRNGGRTKFFTLGFQLFTSRGYVLMPVAKAITVSARFTSRAAQSILDRWTLEVQPFRFEHEGRGSNGILSVLTPSGKKYAFPEKDSVGPAGPGIAGVLRNMERWFYGRLPSGGRIPQKEVGQIVNVAPVLLDLLGPRPYALAPIRTRPERTYDPLKDTPQPEGGHVPMVLARMVSTEPSAWKRLRAALDSFGKTSGLFNDVEVRRMGDKKSGPFQIQVKISGPAFNLVDVGYGVSQVLPIIVDTLRAPKGTTFLLQQPEVHLHPKAQAELGSFLAFVAKEQKKRFVIETHSDHIVDRIRMDIRDRKHVKPNDVALLYFQRENGSVKIHHLELDDTGNIINPPPGYRQFFLREAGRLLGIE